MAGAVVFCLAYTWVAIEEAGVPEVKGLASYNGVNITVIFIKQSYPGHAKHAALAAMGGPNAYHGRFTIVVDDDIDPWDINKVLWALATRCDPARSIDIVRGCWSTYLDPRMDPQRKNMGDTTRGRVIIDACKPYHWKGQYPPVVTVSPDKRASVYQKWKDTLGWN